MIEIVVAAAIVSVTLFAVVGATRLAFQAVEDGALEARAGFLLAEGVEAVKLLRDTSWREHFGKRFANSTTYYPVFSSGAWTLSTADPGPVEGVFTRTVVFAGVCRTSAGVGADDIAAVAESCSSGTYADAGTRFVTVTVSWTRRGGLSRSRVAETYITDIFQN